MLIKKIYPVLLLTFVNILGFTILIPVLPFIFRDFSSQLSYVPLFEADMFYGALLSIYALFMFFGAFIFGGLSDKYGRKPILALSQFGTLCSWVIFGVSYFISPELHLYYIPLPFIVMFVSRISDGLTGGNIAVAQAYLTDITNKAEKTNAFSWVGAAVGAGLIVGPGLGALSSDLYGNYLGTVLLAVIISLVTLISIVFFLPESLSSDKRHNKLTINLNIYYVWKDLNSRALRVLFSLRIATALLFHCFTAVLSLYLIDRYGLNQTSLGYFLLFMGFFVILNNLFLINRIAYYIGNANSLLLGFLLFAFGMFFISISPTLLIFSVFYYFLNLGLNLIFTNQQVLVTLLSRERDQGKIMGLNESLNALCAAIGPSLGTLVYINYESRAFLIFSLVLIIVSAALFKLKSVFNSV
jgi:DHA1 family tetracycline resistance protein-like MFS transporter